MANNGTVTTAFPTSQHHCKDCGLYFESGKSLEVHFQYHKENLLSKWATQAQSAQNDLENNNNTKVKREPVPADSNSDAMMTKPSPEFQQRSTPETSAPFGHPATPQSYHSAPSPYQTPEQTGFSPGQFPPYGPPQFATEQQPAGSWDVYHADYAAHRAPRFHPYGALPERSSHVSSSSPVYGQPPSQPTPSPSPKQCDKCGFVCDSAAQLNEHCSTSHPPTPQGHYRQPQGYPPSKHYGGFQQEPEPEIKEEQEESADILDLDSQKVVHPGGDENGLFEHGAPQPHHNGPNPHSVSAMLSWPDRYGHSHMNGDSQEHKMYPEQKFIPHDQKLYPHEQKLYHEQKMFAATSGQHEKGSFVHQEQKLYQPHQMSIADYQAGPSSSRQDMHQAGPSTTRADVLQSGPSSTRQEMHQQQGSSAYRSFESPAGSQISSSQASNSSASAAPPISGRGANWKSNEARRPKTYNCTACNKWFTSSGHLKRHYNTTLHKNAVRSSGQPDPATLPISTHHHPSRDPTHGGRGQASSAGDPNAQSPLPSDDVRSPEDPQGGSQFTAQSFDRPPHSGMSQSIKGSYMHHPNSAQSNQPLGNNPLANHPLPHQLGTHPLAMGNQPPGLGNPLDSGHHPQGVSAGDQPSSLSNSVGNSPNGLAGPSVHLNHHHSRGLLSVSINNAISPLSGHNLPPFSHLTANPYNPAATDHPALTPQEPPPSIYLTQNFQQNLAPNHPNGMSPHVMDTASNITSTIGEVSAEHFGLESNGPLPSFAQFQNQRYGILVPNFSPIHNVGGSTPSDISQIQSYIIVDAPYSYMSSHHHHMGAQISPDGSSAGTAEPDIPSDYHLTDLEMAKSSAHMNQFTLNRPIKEEYITPDDAHLTNLDQAIKSVKQEYISHNIVSSVKQKDQDISNKENYESHVNSPPSPSIQAEYDNNGSPSISSTVSGLPLTSSNKLSGETGSPDIHKCFECDKLFNRACYLTQHNKSFHSGVKPFKCTRCGKRFPNGVSYEEHYSKHAGDKPFKCDLCPKQFNHKTDLRRHMCLHSGEKPYSCFQCGKGFIRKDHMIKHCETHRKKTKCA